METFDHIILMVVLSVVLLEWIGPVLARTIRRIIDVLEGK